MKGLVQRSRSIAVRAAVVGSMAFGALVASTTSAQAQDELNFTGSARLHDVPGNPNQLFVDFLLNGARDTPDGSITAIETVSPAFAGSITPGVTTGTIMDLTADAGGFLALPVNNFVNIGGFSFTLTGAPNGNTFGPISLVESGNNTFGFFGVSGTVTGGSYGTNVYNYQGTFSTQFTNQSAADVFAAVNSGGTLEKSYSATFIVAQSVVPEPSTYVLLATGLGALALVGLRRRSMQS